MWLQFLKYSQEFKFEIIVTLPSSMLPSYHRNFCERDSRCYFCHLLTHILFQEGTPCECGNKTLLGRDSNAAIILDEAFGSLDFSREFGNVAHEHALSCCPSSLTCFSLHCPSIIISPPTSSNMNLPILIHH